ncbi:MAG TPA: PspA/IM30 family protein [Ktedonobacterales bacterium]|jgi:phage shock protein A
MGLISRFTTYIKTVFSSALDKAEDPGQTLDYSYQQQLEQLTNLRRAIADIVTNEKRLELQQTQAQTQIARYEDQARQALAANREDLARMALERRQNLETQLTGYQQQIEQMKAQQDKFAQMEQRLSARVEAFRTQKEMVKAQYGAAQAQVKISESATGISEEMADVNLAVERAQDKVLTMQARAQAMDQLIEEGTLQDTAMIGPGGDNLDRQLNQISSQSQVDAQLAAMKQQLQLGAGPAPQEPPRLPGGESKE